jgi:hypothetical protein
MPGRGLPSAAMVELLIIALVILLVLWLPRKVRQRRS